MNSFLEAFSGSVLAVVTITAVFGVIIYLLRTWLAERIRQPLIHDFDLKLEQHKDELRRLSRQYGSMQSAANASLLEGQRVTAGFRIKAADEMWREILRLRYVTSFPLTMLDMLDPKEYRLFTTTKHLRSMSLKIDEKQLLSDPMLENTRLFLGDKLFALFFSYRAIVGRICILHKEGVKAGVITSWFRDVHLHRLLLEVLTKEEMEQFQELRSFRVGWIRNLLEGKILHDLREVIAGTQSVNDGLEQASRILKAVEEIQRSQTKG